MLSTTLLTAEVVYNGLGTPRAAGAVVIQEAGDLATVIAVDGLEAARARFPTARERHAGFAITPPPVNAHTHLDLTTMPYRPGSYLDFITGVIEHTRARRRSLAAARRGVDELLGGGTRVIGDIVTREEVMTFLLEHRGLSGVAYWEVIGPDPAAADRIFGETRAKLERFRRLERPGGMRVGISPHAPHTVSAPLLQALARYARRLGLPMQIHVAESPAEVALFLAGGGPLLPWLQDLVPKWRPPGVSPVRFLARLGVLEAQPTLVHMVQVDEEEVRLVRRAGCVVVHCPRSNEALACGRFPWELYARLGVTVALGTDSRGSSSSLSVGDELWAARELHGSKASPLALVRSAVKGGYRALGMRPPHFGRGDAVAGLHLWPSRIPDGGSSGGRSAGGEI